MYFSHTSKVYVLHLQTNVTNFYSSPQLIFNLPLTGTAVINSNNYKLIIKTNPELIVLESYTFWNKQATSLTREGGYKFYVVHLIIAFVPPFPSKNYFKLLH